MVLTFFGYATIALPLAVLPTYVAVRLGYGVVVAGIAISTQYVATILSRSQVGLMADLYGTNGPSSGASWAVSRAGSCTSAAALLAHWPAVSLALILAGRLALGIAESWVSTGAITWAIGQVGPEQTVRIIAWNGIATYGALSVGAPWACCSAAPSASRASACAPACSDWSASR